MRINDKSFPVLPFIEGRRSALLLPIDNTIGMWAGSNGEEGFMTYVKALEGTISLVKNRYYITDTFEDAIFKAMPKIEQDPEWLLPKAQTGILFMRTGATLYMTDYTDKVKVAVFGFTRDSHTCCAFLTQEGTITGCYFDKDAFGVPRQDNSKMQRWMESVLYALYFIDNCEIETIEWKPKEKMKLHNQKIFNESKNTITILDCSWFREFVGSEVFNVDSFWRWQRVGEGFSKKRLVKVKAHTRTYTRRAKKEKHNG